MTKQLEHLKGLNGTMEVYPCCDTLQVKDYCKFNMDGFDKHTRKRCGRNSSRKIWKKHSQ